MSAMNITIRSSEPAEFAEHPERVLEAGSVTSMIGTGTFVAPIAMLRDLAKMSREEIEDLADALAEQELQAMARLGSKVTGINHTLWFIPTLGGRHGPRIKVAIDPKQATRLGGKEASVPFDRDKPASGNIPTRLEFQVRQFIELNQAALLAYWNDETSTDEFIAQLRPIGQ